MKALTARIEALEAAQPAAARCFFIGWRDAATGPLIASYGRERYPQEAGESDADFRQRVGRAAVAALPAAHKAAAVWVERAG